MGATGDSGGGKFRVLGGFRHSGTGLVGSQNMGPLSDSNMDLSGNQINFYNLRKLDLVKTKREGSYVCRNLSDIYKIHEMTEVFKPKKRSLTVLWMSFGNFLDETNEC